jgi:hypothetical protein
MLGNFFSPTLYFLHPSKSTTGDFFVILLSLPGEQPFFGCCRLAGLLVLQGGFFNDASVTFHLFYAPKNSVYPNKYRVENFFPTL